MRLRSPQQRHSSYSSTSVPIICSNRGKKVPSLRSRVSSRHFHRFSCTVMFETHFGKVHSIRGLDDLVHVGVRRQFCHQDTLLILKVVFKRRTFQGELPGRGHLRVSMKAILCGNVFPPLLWSSTPGVCVCGGIFLLHLFFISRSQEYLVF